MGFYEDFIEKYDELAWSEERKQSEKEFYQKIFERHGREIKTVLDCACGTGRHVSVFEKDLQLDVKGSDASESMIQKAKDLKQRKGLEADFKVLDFRKLSEKYEENSFDAVLCIGNSLPHLKEEKDLREAIAEMKKVLKDEGILVIGQRNYDLLRDEKKRFFPVTITEKDAFFYVLDHHEDSITFNVVDLELDNEDFEVYSTEYNALRKKQLEKILKSAGTEIINFYGDNSMKDFDIEEDGTFTVVCRKRAENG